jgi:hypothetical protein
MTSETVIKPVRPILPRSLWIRAWYDATISVLGDWLCIAFLAGTLQWGLQLAHHPLSYGACILLLATAFYTIRTAQKRTS